MVKRLKIGIVGCGAIGGSLAKAIVRDFASRAALSALYDIDAQKSKNLSNLLIKNNKLAVGSLKQLVSKSELVIEAASAKSSFKIAKEALAEGRDIMIMSVGGVVASVRELFNLANKKQAKIYIPSGAISGIDGLKSAGMAKINKVTLTTSKNPISFEGVAYIVKKGINLDKIKKDRVLFSGSAQDAVKYFPQNINVAAILSIVGIGPAKTRVKIIASPKTKKNIHEIEIESDAARIFTRTENILHPKNPKTSYLAVLSAVATLKQILEPMRVGT